MPEVFYEDKITNAYAMFLIVFFFFGGGGGGQKKKLTIISGLS